jgi:hypothetical protein
VAHLSREGRKRNSQSQPGTHLSQFLRRGVHQRKGHMSKSRKSRWSQGCAWALGFAAAAMLSTVTLSATTLVSASANVINPLGVYGGDGPGADNALCQSTGPQCGYAMSFLDDTSWQKMENPSWFISQFAGSKYSMIWGVPMLPNIGNYSLAAGAGGAYDQYFVTLAQGLVSGGQGNSIIRMGWEFNEGWAPWAASGQATNFIAYWRQIVTSMRSVPGANFQFEWNPNIGAQSAGNLAAFYPGNDYVNLIGLDVYDISWGSYPGAAKLFSTLLTEPYGLNWLTSFAAQQGKPMTLPEWGLGWGASDNGAPVTDPGSETSGGDDSTFINDMAGWIATHHVVEATLWDVGQSAISTTENPNGFAAAVADFGTRTAKVSALNRTARKPDVSVQFIGSSASITSSSRNSLEALAKGLNEGDSLTVVGRSYRDAKLAKVRAHSIVHFLTSRRKFHFIVTVSTTTRADASTVTSKAIHQ